MGVARFRKMTNYVLLQTLLAFCFCACGFAQIAGGSLSGTVSDTSGALVAGAQIIVRNTNTGVSRRVVADAAGFFGAPNLLPGNYELTVSAPGFATQARTGIKLDIGSQQVINVAMSVGQQAETVSVRSDIAGVELATSSIGGVVGGTTVRELPLNGRDWTQLATLQPGVVAISSLQSSATGGAGGLGGFTRGSRGFGSQMSIDGGRPQQNNYRIDGVSVNDYANGGPGDVLGASLGVDAIQEFSVITSNYSAEYGRASGGVINAITRSGTNKLHGDVYEFIRNGALDARNFFDTTTPPFTRNEFGGAVGGPIRKDRLFFFVDYEGLLQSKGITAVNNVPSLDARKGIIHNANGTTTTLTVDSKVVPFLALWPAPNGALLGTGNTGLYTFAGNQTTSENFLTARMDYTLSASDTLSGSYQFDRASFAGPDSLGDVVNGTITARQLVTVSETHIFSPQLLNTFHVGYNRSAPANAFPLQALNPAAGDNALGPVPGQNAPQLFVPGLTTFTAGLGGATNNSFHWNSYQAFDDVFLTKGIHNIKFGANFERMQDNYKSFITPSGRFRFGSLNKFLTNDPSSFFIGLPGKDFNYQGFRQSIIGSYFQDDIRVRRNLTLNVGLRYEMSTNVTEVANKLAALPTLTATAPVLGGPLFNNPTYRNFEPRLGVVWDPFGSGKTSVRAGFGFFDVLPLIYEYEIAEDGAAPFLYQVSAPSPLPHGSFPTGAFSTIVGTGLAREPYIQPNPKRNYVMQWNLSVQREITPSLTGTLAYVASRGVHQPFRADDVNIVQPKLVSGRYFWPNPVGSGTQINPGFGRIDAVSWTGDSYYHAFEAQVEKKMSHGVQVQGSFTWGKSIDTGSQSMLGDPYANSIASLFLFDPRVERGLSDFNVARNLVINGIWNVPGPRHGGVALRTLAGGWELGGIYSIQNGLPFTPVLGGDPLGEKNTVPYAFPDRLSGSGCDTGVNPGNITNYIKLNCFSVPLIPSGQSSLCQPFPGATVSNTCINVLGNTRRNSIIGPGLYNLDLSLFKNVYVPKISDTFNTQFRLELFNALNHPNFATPINNSVLFDQTGALVSGAGQITATSNDSREIQVAVKIVF